MSEKTYTRRTCDQCGKTYDFPNGNYSDKDLAEIVNWIGLVGFSTPDIPSQPVPYIKHFERTACLQAYLSVTQ